MSEQPTDKELDIKRRLARRRMAWISFGTLLVYGVALMLGVWLGPEGFAAGISTVAGVLNMILGAFVAIILGYLGASAYEAVKK